MTLRRRLPQFVSWFILGLLLVGLFLWLPTARDMFWWRRSCLLAAGGLAAVYLYCFERPRWQWLWCQHLLVGLLVIATILLLVRSPWPDGLIGRPALHPSTASLWASVFLGLFLSTLPHRRLLKGFYAAIVWCAAVSFLFWLGSTTRGRLGFIDGQIIYASYLYLVAILIGCWLWSKGELRRAAALTSLGFLFACLVLTQTRSALAILAICLAWQYRHAFKHKLSRQANAIAVTAMVIAASTGVAIVCLLPSSRLTDRSYFAKSLTYRTQLAQAGLPRSLAGWLLGGGVGGIEANITNNASGYTDLAPDIQQGVRFESSHNYLVDLVVERGLVVTALMVALVVHALHKKPISSQGPLHALLGSTVLFLLVNNINLPIELLAWTSIIWLLAPRAERHQKADRLLQ